MTKGAGQDGKTRRRGVQPVGDLIADLLDPVLARKTGMTTGLVAAWPELVGPRLAETTRAEKLVWPPRRMEDDPFEPATLVVACEGAVVLRLQHQASELVGRINAFFGFPAVARLRIVQKAVRVAKIDRKPKLRVLEDGERLRIAAMTQGIEDPKLRAALARFGESVLQRAVRPDDGR